MIISIHSLVLYIIFLIYVGIYLGHVMFTTEISRLLICEHSYKYGTWISFIKSINSIKDSIHKSGKILNYKIDSESKVLILIASSLKSIKPDSLVLKPEFEYLLNNNIDSEDDIVSAFNYNFCLVGDTLLIFDPISYFIYNIWRLYKRLNCKKY